MSLVHSGHFSILESAGGEGGAIPIRVSNLNVLQLSEKTVDCSRWVLAIAGVFLYKVNICPNCD